MNTKIKKIFIFGIMLSLIVLNNAFVYASSFKFDAKAEKEIYKLGEEVYVDMNISEINAGTYGINVIGADLEYDENVFESIEFINKNKWEYEYNSSKTSEKYGKVLFTNISSGVKEAEGIGMIKFKLKSNLSDMETQIKLKQITSNDGKNLLSQGDRIITIKIVNDKKQDEPKDEPKDEQKNETKQETIKENNNIPQTGQTRIIYIIVGVIIAGCIIVLSIIAVLKKKKENKH